MYFFTVRTTRKCTVERKCSSHFVFKLHPCFYVFVILAKKNYVHIYRINYVSLMDMFLMAYFLSFLTCLLPLLNLKGMNMKTELKTGVYNHTLVLCFKFWIPSSSKFISEYKLKYNEALQKYTLSVFGLLTLWLIAICYQKVTKPSYSLFVFVIHWIQFCWELGDMQKVFNTLLQSICQHAN